GVAPTQFRGAVVYILCVECLDVPWIPDRTLCPEKISGVGKARTQVGNDGGVDRVGVSRAHVIGQPVRICHGEVTHHVFASVGQAKVCACRHTADTLRRMATRTALIRNPNGPLARESKRPELELTWTCIAQLARREISLRLARTRTRQRGR